MNWFKNNFRLKGHNKKIFGISKLDVEIVSHRRKHGAFINPEVLARCPICNKDHRVFYFECKCGDPFFCHLNNEEKNFEKWPTGKFDRRGSFTVNLSMSNSAGVSLSQFLHFTVPLIFIGI